MAQYRPYCMRATFADGTSTQTMGEPGDVPRTKPVYYPPHYRPRRTAKGYYRWGTCDRFPVWFENCLVICFVCDAEGIAKQVRAVDQELHLLLHGVSFADYEERYGDNGRFQYGLLCDWFPGADDE